MPDRLRIPRPTAKRLSLYMREAGLRLRDGVEQVSSRQLGETLGVTDAQVRKDLAYLGQSGQPGVGYPTRDLHDRIRHAMGTDRQWNAVLVGAGRIGRALLAYPSFEREDFRIVAVLDSDPALAGRTMEGRRIWPMAEMARLVREHGCRIGIIAVPREAAQGVADQLVMARVTGILNFAPLRVEVPKSTCVISVDFTVALEQLAFEINLASANGTAG